MKLIEKFRSDYYGADNYVYEFENGLKVVVTHKKDSEDFYAGVVFKNGMGAEYQLKVPGGSAHFLEHVMVFSPGKFFKTAQEKREFGYGNDKYPSLEINGATSMNFMWVHSNGHMKGRSRMMKMVESYIQPERADLESELENQRKIIIAERDRKKKKEFDGYIQYIKFMLEDFYPELAHYVLGEPEEITKMYMDDLMKLRAEYMKGRNAIVTIQTNRWPDKSVSKRIEKLSKYFSSEKSSLIYEYREFEDKFRVGHMLDPEKQDVFISFNTLYKRNKAEGDKELVYELFGRRFVWKIMYEYLREKKNLTYGVKAYVESLYTIYENKGFSTSIPVNKLVDTLDAIDHVYETFWKEFLYSDYGTIWFDGMKSDYIFKNTVNYDINFALDRGFDILSEVETRTNYKEQIKIAKDFTKKDLEMYFIKHYINKPKKVWMASSEKGDKILEIFKASKLYDRLSKQK